MSFNSSYFEVPSNQIKWWSSRDSDKTMAYHISDASNDLSVAVNYKGVESTIAISNENVHVNHPSIISQDLHSLNQNVTCVTQPGYTANSADSNEWLAGVSHGHFLVGSHSNSSILSEHEVINGTVTQLLSNFGYIDDSIIFSFSDVIGAMVKVGDEVVINITYEPDNKSKYKDVQISKKSFKPVSNSDLNEAKLMTEQYKVLSSVNNDKGIQDTRRNTHDIASINKENHSCVKTKKSAIISSPTEKLQSKKHSSARSDLISFKINKTTSLKRKLETIKEKSPSLKHDSKEIKDKLSDLRHNSGDIKDRSVDKNGKSSVEKVKNNNAQKIKDLESNQPKNDVESTVPKLIAPFKIQNINNSDSRRGRIDSTSKEVSKIFDSFALTELDCSILRSQFRTLPLPPQLFHMSLKFQDSFPLNNPLKLGNNCHFKVMDKSVKSICTTVNEELNRNVDPYDANTSFIVKVMLLSTDDLTKFYKNTLTLAEEYNSDIKVPITKAIKFLIASMGENKEFGIGGAWSPSLDGLNPQSDPRVLINTAIRTCRAMTGIDLSKCTSWQKFLEIRYYRPLQKRNETPLTNLSYMENDSNEYREPRMETVVYFIPDVWSIVPSEGTWTEIKRRYEEQVNCYTCPPSSNVVEDLINEDYNLPLAQNTNHKDMNNTKEVASCAADQPTHFSKLTPVTMKVADIKRELTMRKLNNRGVVDQLRARLLTILQREENEERIKVTQVIPPATNIQEPTIADDTRLKMKSLYSLPESPHIITHQNISTDIRIKTMSLHSLLSYHDRTLEENTFELAVFAKHFLDMLRRDAVFNIYKSIVIASEEDLMWKEDSGKRAKLSAPASKRTINKSLLFSCSLLDREKTNKIFLEDLKTLIEGLGICLSSKQLSNVLNKLRQNSKYFKYRQLTDRIMTDSDMNKMINVEVNEDLDYIHELARGNKALFDVQEMTVDPRFNAVEVKRLRNELQKSEEKRRHLELKVTEIKQHGETGKFISQRDLQAIENLRFRGSEYECKYITEKHRADQYERDYNSLVNQLDGIDKMSKKMVKLVGKSLDMFTKADEERFILSVNYKKKSKKSKKKNRQECHSKDDDVMGSITTNELTTEAAVNSSSHSDIVAPEETCTDSI